MKIFKEPQKSGSSKSQKTQSATTDAKPDIPLTSLEAHQILSAGNSAGTIAHFIFYFNRLIDVKQSVLTDLTRGSDKIVDNQQFLDDLNDTAEKVIKALKHKSPYKAFFGDVVKLQNQLQVVLRYYKEQCEQQQPVANAYLFQTRVQNSMFTDVLSGADAVLSPEVSERLIKYTINFSADSIMQLEIPELSSFITQQLLNDHSSEPDFSYLKSK